MCHNELGQGTLYNLLVITVAHRRALFSRSTLLIAARTRSRCTRWPRDRLYPNKYDCPVVVPCRDIYPRITSRVCRHLCLTKLRDPKSTRLTVLLPISASSQTRTDLFQKNNHRAAVNCFCNIDPYSDQGHFAERRATGQDNWKGAPLSETQNEIVLANKNTSFIENILTNKNVIYRMKIFLGNKIISFIEWKYF